MTLRNGEYKTSVHKFMREATTHPWVVADYIPDCTTAFKTWHEAIAFALNWRCCG